MDNAEDILNYDLSDISEEVKMGLVNSMISIAGENLGKLFYSLKLKNKIEGMIINDTNGDEFLLTFQKITPQNTPNKV